MRPSLYAAQRLRASLAQTRSISGSGLSRSEKNRVDQTELLTVGQIANL